MKTMLLTLLATTLCLGRLSRRTDRPPQPAGSLAPPLKAHPDSKAWADVFRPDLSDASFPAGVWTFAGGILTASEDQNIWTKADYGDCVLDLEFKFDAGANSGVFVYNSDPKSWMPASVEIQICDDAAKQWKDQPANWHAGAFFGHQAPVKSAVKAAGEWNRMTLTCQGPRIATLLNGQSVCDIDLSRWTSGTKNPDGSDIPAWLHGKPWSQLPCHGRIGLQGRHAGAGIYFRNVKIQKLSSIAQ